jgi:hypothetical protein
MASQHNFFETLKINYGNSTHTLFKQIWKDNEKLSKMFARKDFLLKCKSYGVFPAHIKQSFKNAYNLIEERSPYKSKMFRNITEFQSKTLAVEIKQTFYKIKCLRTRLTENCNEAAKRTPRNACLSLFNRRKSSRICSK